MTRRRKHLLTILILSITKIIQSYHLRPKHPLSFVPVIQPPIIVDHYSVPSIIISQLHPPPRTYFKTNNTLVKYHPFTPKPWRYGLPSRSSSKVVSTNDKTNIKITVGDQESSSLPAGAVISDQSDEKFAKTEVAVNNVITTITPDKKSESESQHGTKTNFSIPDFIIQDSSCQHLGFLFQFEWS